jgi:signal peptidase
MRTARTIGGWTAGVVSALAAAVVVAYAVLLVLGYRPAVVLSGSMEPTLGVGSIAFVQSVRSGEVQVGDVITFADPHDPDRMITHRVASKLERAGRPAAYRTKGDANPRLDPWTIELPPRAGRLAFAVPDAGYALTVAATREVRTAVILALGLVLLLGLLRRIWRPSPTASETAP